MVILQQQYNQGWKLVFSLSEVYFSRVCSNIGLRSKISLFQFEVHQPEVFKELQIVQVCTY